jgi:hypothetical protein
LASDRSPAAEAVQLALWRRMSPLEKARVTSELTRSAYLLSLAGVRRRHPSASERECFLRLALVTLGRALACRVYPEAASLVDP